MAVGVRSSDHKNTNAEAEPLFAIDTSVMQREVPKYFANP
jgi:hypothetical protein